MPAALIVQLLTIFGPSAISLIDSLITKWENNGSVTAAEWSDLAASLKLSAQDHMKARLAVAGIALDSPQGVALLAATK